MRLDEYLATQAVSADLSAGTKDDVLAELVGLLVGAHPDIDAGRALAVLRERERLGTTGIGDGVAIPHGKLEGLAPEGAAGQHLRLLAHISRMLKSEDFRNALLNAPDADAFVKLLAAA